MVWTPPQNARQSLAKDDLPMNTARQEEKRKTAAFMKKPGDGLHEEQKHGRRYGIDIFGVWEWMDGSWLYRSYIYIYIYNLNINTNNFGTAVLF